MAILGTYIDKTTVSRAGDALSGVTMAALAHSLPATSPQTVLPVLRSAEGVGVSPAPSLLGLGGNASQSTIGYHSGSVASLPTVLFDVYAMIWHTLIN